MSKAKSSRTEKQNSAARKVSGADLEVRRLQRLQTTEILKSGRTPLQVIEVAEKAVLLSERSVEIVLALDPPAKPSACQEACDWCCHKRVGAVIPEVLRIVAFVRKHCTAPEVDSLRERAIRLDDERRRLVNDTWAAQRLPCPLLVEHRCSVHPVRPLTCRGYNSSDAGKCEELFRSRHKVDVPAYAPQFRINTLALDGVRAGLGEAGLASDLLDLTAALRIALTTPDTDERWLRGEKVFAAARLI